MSTTSVTMSDEQFQRLKRIVYERSGIDFQASKKYVLEARLSRRVEELEMTDFDQYLSFITFGPYRNDEFQEMFNRITVNETSFFRNEAQLSVFEKQILPKLLEARRATRRLRIWSSACSTGEEPYTLAIQVRRSLGLRLADWNVEILGTDISEKVLLAAQAGRYSPYSMRSVNPLVVRSHFTELPGGFYQINDDVRQMVRFELLNLKDAAAGRRFGTWDVIFCRNVLIYFDDAMKSHCAQLFADQLAADGVLFIGHSESLRNVTAAFEPMPIPQGFAYAKAAAAANPHRCKHVA